MTTWERLGERLRLAREHASFSQTEAASELGITPAALSQYESGKRRIDVLALDRLSQLYGAPVNYFLGEDRSLPDWETALHSRAQVLSIAGKRGVSELVHKVRDFEELHHHTDSPLSGHPHPPFQPLEPRRYRDEDVAQWAEKARRHFNVGTAPLPNLREFLAARGYQIFTIPLGNEEEDVSGLFFLHPKLGSIIAVNEDKAYTRRPFTMAHELAHGLFHYHLPVILCRSLSREPLERFANQFAAHFLVPGDALRDRVQDFGVQTIADPSQVIHLARYFGVSYAAMRWRLQAERRLAHPDDARWDVRPVTLAVKLGYTPDPYELGKRPLPLEERFPRDFLDLALQAVLASRLSLRRVAEMLDISHLELEDLLEPAEELSEDLEEVYV